MLFNIKIATFFVAFGSLSLSAVARPVIAKREFTELAYNTFQISDGVGGNAEAEANAVFSDNFTGVDLATVSEADLDAVNNMARAAVDAEAAFNDAIADASGADADALQVGKIKNKVLKLAGQVLVLQIESAQGEDVADKLAEEQAKLTENISLDEDNAGQPSQSVSFVADTEADL